MIWGEGSVEFTKDLDWKRSARALNLRWLGNNGGSCSFPFGIVAAFGLYL